MATQVFKSTSSDNTVSVGARGQIEIMKDYEGLYVDLTEADRTSLAYALLESVFEVDYDSNGYEDVLTLTKRETKVKVGQYYRYNSNPYSSSGFQGDPIIKVTKVYPSGEFSVETMDGHQSSWPADKVDLTGPLNIEEKTITVWEEV